MQINKYSNAFKLNTKIFNFFNIGIFLLPSVPLIGSLLILIACFYNRSKVNKYLKDIWNLPFLISTLLIILSCINNSLFRNEIYKDVISIDLIWFGLANWLPYFWIFWISQKFSNNFKNRKKICFLLISGSLPIIISGLLQYFLKLHGPFIFFNGLVTWYSRRIHSMDGMTGIFNNANYLGTWLNIIWPISLVSLIENIKKPKRRIFSILFVAGILICTILTFSRNAWIGLLIGTLCIFGIKSIKLIAPFLILIILPVLMALGFIPNERLINLSQKIVPETILHQFNSIGIQNLDSFPRIKIWSESINYISIKPLLGWGASSFPSLFEINNNSTFFGHTHNLPLELSLSFGIPVALIIITVITLLIIRSKNIVFQKNFIRNNVSYDKAWWTSTLLILSFHLFDLTYFDIRIGLTLWILLGGLKNIILEKSASLNPK